MTASAPRTNPISRLNSPARTYRCRRFACALTGTNARLAATVGRYSFDAGLSHSHLTAGLSRRTMTQSDLPADLGLHLATAWADTVAISTALWRADVQRRRFLVSAAFSAAAMPGSALRWLTSPQASAPTS